jgi:ferritin-like metal-binding protein YciE
MPVLIFTYFKNIFMATQTDKTETLTAAKNQTDGKGDTIKTAKTKTNGQSEALGSDADLQPLEKFFMDALKDVYWAEKALTEALPKMQKAATTDELQEAFEDHTLVTQKHVSRLEKVFRLLGKPAEAKKCEAMQGLIKEGESIINETPEGSMTRDAALIIAAQKVEHYEIATYGGLIQLALTLGKTDVANILEMTLQEEEDTDMQLTDIAETCINFMAQEETPEDIEDL